MVWAFRVQRGKLIRRESLQLPDLRRVFGSIGAGLSSIKDLDSRLIRSQTRSFSIRKNAWVMHSSSSVSTDRLLKEVSESAALDLNPVKIREHPLIGAVQSD